MKQSFQFKFLFLCFSLDSSRISQINVFLLKPKCNQSRSYFLQFRRQLECANLTTKTTQNSETSLSGFREKMSTGNHRRISPEEVQNVKNQIEQCLWNYMNKKQAMDILYQKQNIEPIFTKLVWERLEEENQEFFKTYYLKLALKNQITQFNYLLYQQAVADLNQANNPHGVACNGSHLHGSNFGFHQGVNHNNVPENVAVKAENMQQYNFPAVVQGGLNGGGPFVQSVMQNGPVNMAVGTQNGNGVAVGGPEGYFGNSRFFYQATHVNGNVNGNGNGMESHHDVSSFGNADSIPVSYRLNGTVMDEAHSSHQLLRQFGQPESRGENSRVGNISRNFDFQNFGRDS